MKKCLIIGAIILDIILKIDNIPKTGDDINIKNTNMVIGGCAYNVSDILNHFNIKHDLFAPLGDGFFSNIIREKLEKDNKKSFLNIKNKDNGYCIALIENNGERTFLTYQGIECNFQKEWFNKININDYDTVYISGYELETDKTDAILSILENKNLNIYYAPGPRFKYISKEKHNKLKKLKPKIHLNEIEALEFTNANSYKEAAVILYKFFQNDIFITLGKNGIYYLGNEILNKNSKYEYKNKIKEIQNIKITINEKEEKNLTSILISSFKSNVIDTNGAGDANIASIISLKKKNKDIIETLINANKVSSMIVSINRPNLTKSEFIKGGFYEI